MDDKLHQASANHGPHPTFAGNMLDPRTADAAYQKTFGDIPRDHFMGPALDERKLDEVPHYQGVPPVEAVIPEVIPEVRNAGIASAGTASVAHAPITGAGAAPVGPGYGAGAEHAVGTGVGHHGVGHHGVGSGVGTGVGTGVGAGIASSAGHHGEGHHGILGHHNAGSNVGTGIGSGVAPDAGHHGTTGHHGILGHHGAGSSVGTGVGSGVGTGVGSETGQHGILGHHGTGHHTTGTAAGTGVGSGIGAALDPRVDGPHGRTSQDYPRTSHSHVGATGASTTGAGLVAAATARNERHSHDHGRSSLDRSSGIPSDRMNDRTDYLPENRHASTGDPSIEERVRHAERVPFGEVAEGEKDPRRGYTDNAPTAGARTGHESVGQEGGKHHGLLEKLGLKHH